MKELAIMKIMQASNLQEKEIIYAFFKEILADCRIFLFDQKCSNFGESCKNKKIGACWILGIGDYVMQINPVKAVIIIDNKLHVVHQMNIENVCKKQELLNNAYYNNHLREMKIKNINFSEMRKQLEFQILSKVCS